MGLLDSFYHLNSISECGYTQIKKNKTKLNCVYISLDSNRKQHIQVRII